MAKKEAENENPRKDLEAMSSSSPYGFYGQLELSSQELRNELNASREHIANKSILTERRTLKIAEETLKDR